ncbi:gamma-glutamylcyclotransferase-like [Styela clava]
MNSFKYFAYGSNLSLYRLVCSCPSAKKFCNGQLSGYKLSFGRFSKGWKGGVASIEESISDRVCGVIWDIPDTELPALDLQEDLGGSQPYNDPSPQYLEAIVDGAITNELDNEYLQKLKDTKTNGNTEITKLMLKVADLKEKMHPG